MANTPITMILSLEDAAREDDLAAALAEERGIVVAHGADFDRPEHADVIVVDSRPLDDRTPHVVWSDSGPDGPAGRNILARLPESAPVEMVAAAARLVASGYRVARTAGRDDEAGEGAEQPARPAGERFHLSAREHEVLELLAEGAQNKVIARRLDISVHTAKFHVASIVSKLHAANRTDAIAIAMREGLVLL